MYCVFQCFSHSCTWNIEKNTGRDTQFGIMLINVRVHYGVLSPSGSGCLCCQRQSLGGCEHAQWDHTHLPYHTLWRYIHVWIYIIHACKLRLMHMYSQHFTVHSWFINWRTLVMYTLQKSNSEYLYIDSTCGYFDIAVFLQYWPWYLCYM